MNFLSHYYLHRNTNDNHFTVGLTVPDLLSFHSNRVRVSESFINNSIIQFPVNLSFFKGMQTHISLDKFFHGSDFFKEKINLMQNMYKEKVRNDFLPGIIIHILLEIIIDRYLLTIEPHLADEFYNSYKLFDFKTISNSLILLKNFDTNNFIALAEQISFSSFLRDYPDNEAVGLIIYRISKRYDMNIYYDTDKKNLEKYFESSFQLLYNDIKNFIDFLVLNKNNNLI